MEKYIKNEANRAYPDLKVKLGEVNLSFPLGIKIEGLGISTENAPDIIVYESERTTIKPGIFTYVLGNRKYSFRSSTMGGNISGSVHYENKNEVKARIRLRDIQLGNRIFIHPIITKRLECMVNGEINFTGDLSSPENGDSELFLELSDGKFELINPILRLPEIGFHKVNLTAELKNKKISISRSELTGDGIKGAASGTIRLNNNFTASRLDLTGELEFSSTFFQDMPDVRKAVNMLTSEREDGKLSFNVKGTIEKPLFNFNRR